MKVFLRQRKQSTKGKTSLYLELYKGTIKTADGRVKPVREYEYLNLYLSDKPTNPIDKQQNKDYKALAENIRAKRELEIKEGQHGFIANFKGKANFIDYCKHLTQNKTTRGNKVNWHSTTLLLIGYAGTNVPFKAIDKAFCEGFKTYLDTIKGKMGNPLGSNTKSNYFSKFKAVLNQAVKDGIIGISPANGIANAKHIEAQRQYLSIDEVKALAKTPCRYQVLKNAFLFSCLTGLRFSDVHKLQWQDLQHLNDNWRITFRQKKTKGLEYLDINQQARQLMGSPANATEPVFKDLKYNVYFNKQLQQWVQDAGITKPITFHCARHTFAVMQLTLGTEIFTVSKLLGHENLKTTQVYAKIIDAKKQEAVKRIPEIFI